MSIVNLCPTVIGKWQFISHFTYAAVDNAAFVFVILPTDYIKMITQSDKTSTR